MGVERVGVCEAVGMRHGGRSSASGVHCLQNVTRRRGRRWVEAALGTGVERG